MQLFIVFFKLTFFSVRFGLLKLYNGYIFGNWTNLKVSFYFSPKCILIYHFQNKQSVIWKLEAVLLEIQTFFF